MKEKDEYTYLMGGDEALGFLGEHLRSKILEGSGERAKLIRSFFESHLNHELSVTCGVNLKLFNLLHQPQPGEPVVSHELHFRCECEKTPVALTVHFMLALPIIKEGFGGTVYDNRHPFLLQLSAETKEQ